MSFNEPDLERAIDRAVMRRLATDRAYRNAENAEQQKEREEEIERAEENRLRRENGLPVIDFTAR